MLRRAQGIEPTPEEAAEEQRLARLNGEVKRHLTTILLEVTDGVFGARPGAAGLHALVCGPGWPGCMLEAGILVSLWVPVWVSLPAQAWLASQERLVHRQVQPARSLWSGDRAGPSRGSTPRGGAQCGPGVRVYCAYSAGPGHPAAVAGASRGAVLARSVTFGLGIRPSAGWPQWLGDKTAPGQDVQGVWDSLGGFPLHVVWASSHTQARSKKAHC